MVPLVCDRALDGLTCACINAVCRCPVGRWFWCPYGHKICCPVSMRKLVVYALAWANFVFGLLATLRNMLKVVHHAHHISVRTKWKMYSQLLAKLHPWRLTWNLRISPWKRRFLLETIIFRFHFKLWGCIHSFWNSNFYFFCKTFRPLFRPELVEQASREGSKNQEAATYLASDPSEKKHWHLAGGSQ